MLRCPLFQPRPSLQLKRTRLQPLTTTTCRQPPDNGRMLPILASNVINAVTIQRNSQRRNAIKFTSATTGHVNKENTAPDSNRMSSSSSAMTTTRSNNNNATDIPQLCDWFLKEKRDHFKRRGSILPGSGSNRRWFTIEHIPSNDGSSASNDNDDGEHKIELALCYYKRNNDDKERSGWLFLSDVLSLAQDLPGRWIILEHPTRILRIQSPTPAQHRVWYSTLTKSCKNVRKEVASPSPTKVC